MHKRDDGRPFVVRADNGGAGGQGVNRILAGSGVSSPNDFNGADHSDPIVIGPTANTSGRLQ